MMDGDILIDSAPGKGSAFTVLLPQGVADARALGKDVAENLKTFRLSSSSRMKRVQVKRDYMPYGSVLVVDDVETNIYVARGLLMPYKLKVQSADSGFAAIEKVKAGNVYDVIFMDHMMPVMDGVETTKRLREMGYDRPVVALTANAVAGQAELYMESGFDDFISKPIDIRQLNNVLNKHVRDRRQNGADAENGLAGDAAPRTADRKFAEIFIRDADRSIAALNAFLAKDGFYGADDIKKFIVHTHGMKSALSIVGEYALSETAGRLEILGRKNELKQITAETPAFIDALQTAAKKLAPREDDTNADEDRPFLEEQLEKLKTACESFDEDAAQDAMAALNERNWPRQTGELLKDISIKLLHSDFEEIAEVIKIFLNN